jgi:hypothetical protein
MCVIVAHVSLSKVDNWKTSIFKDGK